MSNSNDISLDFWIQVGQARSGGGVAVLLLLCFLFPKVVKDRKRETLKERADCGNMTLPGSVSIQSTYYIFILHTIIQDCCSVQSVCHGYIADSEA